MDTTSVRARDVIDAIVENMLQGLEPLVTKILAPSLYDVHLHVDDLERLRGILSEIEAQARLLLDENLERLNRPRMPGWLWRQRRRMRYESAEGDWYICFAEDPNGDLEPGTIEVISELAAEPPSEYGGTKTKLVSTRRRHGRFTAQKTETDAKPAYAKLSYEDDAGRRLYRMTKTQIVIGRGAPDVWTDLRLQTRPDVSRQHARIKYESQTRQFLIKDLSTYGTTLDGERVPPSLEVVDGENRDADRWIPLPDGARIGLGDVIFLHFERVVRAQEAPPQRDE